MLIQDVRVAIVLTVASTSAVVLAMAAVPLNVHINNKVSGSVFRTLLAPLIQCCPCVKSNNKINQLVYLALYATYHCLSAIAQRLHCRLPT
jgi:hypothetical protein